MVSSRIRLALIGLAAVFGAASSGLRAEDAKPGVEPKAAFERLKSLAGEWKSDSGHAGEPAFKVIYKVTSNGSVVMETIAPGTDHEMVSMYHLDGGDLKMTHYCMLKNQPRVKLDAKASTPDRLVFDFDGGTNLDPAKDMHMHSVRILFKDKDHVESEWEAYQDGKKAGSHAYKLSRP